MMTLTPSNKHTFYTYINKKWHRTAVFVPLILSIQTKHLTLHKF